MPDAATPNSQASRDDAVAIVRRLRDAGHVAYFAGGCVRDTLLNLQPKDYDVATDAPPQRVRQLFKSTQAVGAAFGVILVRQGSSTIEVATFRTDLQYKDGRRPEGVVFTTAEEDAKRRDFTINGLFMDPLYGDKVIDYVGGQEDLQGKLIRAIGEPEHRFEEDHLRMLRAIRFAARLGFKIESKTSLAILAHYTQLKRISPERIAEELRLMLTPPTRLRAWHELISHHLEFEIFRYVPTSGGHQGTTPILSELAPNRSVPFGLALAAAAVGHRTHLGNVLWVFDKDATREIVQGCRTALKISNDEANMLEACVYLAPLLRTEPPTVARMKRFLAAPYSAQAREMLSATGQAWPLFRERAEWLQSRFEEFSQTDFAPQPLVTGDDLTAAGLSPGPLFKRILDAAYDAQLEGHISNKDQALQLALQLAKRD